MPRNPTKPLRSNKIDAQLIARALARSKNRGIDTGVLLTALIDQWGGTTKFARDIFEEFQAGKVGGQSRQKIVEMVTRLVVVTTNQAIARPRVPADMDDDELDTAIIDLNGRLVTVYEEGVDDASGSAPATAAPPK